MTCVTPLTELEERLLRFRQRMTLRHPKWEMAVVFSKMNLLYFCGCMPEGMLVLPREGEPVLWVRRSFERSREESAFKDIRPMNSYRDAAAAYPNLPASVHLETEFVPLSMYQRFQKHFPFAEYHSMDYDLGMTKAVKSPWELTHMEEAGRRHQRVLEVRVPEILEEGMTEFERAGRLYQVMLEEGHMGVARFNMFDTEMVVGQLGFGESSLYPTSFNGPGGNYGQQPAMPAASGRLVIMNIHQPSSDSYKMFDKLLIIDKGGYAVYYGPAMQVPSYLKKALRLADAGENECQTRSEERRVGKERGSRWVPYH